MKNILITILLVSTMCLCSTESLQRDVANHTVLSAGITKFADATINAMRRDHYLKQVGKKYEYQLTCSESKELIAIQADKSLLFFGASLLFFGKEIFDLDKTGFSINDLVFDYLGYGLVVFELKF